MNQDEKIIWEAEFNPAVTTYWLTSGILALTLSVVGIPLLPIWIILGKIFTGKYLASHKATLTNRMLRVSKGIFTKVEKAVPLDRITDVGVVQGPLMRVFEVETLSVETAGQSAVGSLIHLTGVKNGREFKEVILRQRDLVVGSQEELAATRPESSTQPTAPADVFAKMLAVLERIESKLDSKQ